MGLPHHGIVRTRAYVRGLGIVAQLVVAHDEVAEAIGAVGYRLELRPTVGAAEAIDDMQVWPR